jgi:hypothetical protein
VASLAESAVADGVPAPASQASTTGVGA